MNPCQKYLVSQLPAWRPRWFRNGGRLGPPRVASSLDYRERTMALIQSTFRVIADL